MPNTVEGLLFIIGALFLLIGFVGGGFEVSAAKIPAVGKTGRLGSTVVGAVCLALATRSFIARQPGSQAPAPRADTTPTLSPPQALTDTAEPPHPAIAPDQCKAGYVWREARPSDHICVTEETRSRTALENSRVNEFKNPVGGPYGADTCRDGYVWRDTFEGDHVCVSPESRSLAAADNSQATVRLAH
jgi:hypothetical protein